MSTRFAVAAVALSALAATIAHADRSVAYCITQGSPATIRVFDLANPAQFRTVSLSPAPNSFPGGMDFDDRGILYLTDWSTAVYRVNTISGALTMLPQRFEPFGSFGKDLSWDPHAGMLVGMRFGQLQSLPGTTNQYYHIDRDTGQGRRLGILSGLPTPGGGGQAVLGLAIQPDGKCVLAHYSSNRLYYTASTSAFEASSYDNTIGTPNFFEGLGCDWARTGIVYTVATSGTGVRQVNPDGSTQLVVALSESYADIAIDPLCAADFNRDRTVDFFDYLDFVSAFATNSITADFDFSGTLDLFDYLDFVGHFAQGC